jgi:OCT family organic cation transporter-like MFS transporter 4/5
VEKVGRRIPFSVFMIIEGVACISMVFTIIHVVEGNQNDVYHILTLVLALIGRFCISVAFSILYIHSAEIFPTVLRNAGLGGASVFAGIGSMTAPYIVTFVGHIKIFINKMT